ncbi:MAG: amidohydrolase family protein, partial [Coriobacteriales bacterium]|nr:amidohydrolase family protein [Coriobacteriales bacterium]
AIPNFDYTLEQKVEGIKKGQEVFASRGFTYVCDCMADYEAYDIFDKMAKEGVLNLRVDGVYNINDATRDADLEYTKANLGKYDVDDLVKVDTAKYFVDGDLAMFEPYLDEYNAQNGKPSGYGTSECLLWDLDHLEQSMTDVQSLGLKIHVHAMGDLGAQVSIDRMNAAKECDPTGKVRNILAHCSYVADEEKDKMAKGGIIASIQPQWELEHIELSDITAKMMGMDRFYQVYPNKSFVDRGVVTAYGSDFSVNESLPLAGIYTAIKRLPDKTHAMYEAAKNLDTMNPAECVSLKDAIMGYTIYPAYQFHREDITGSLELGKSADMVIFAENIEAIDVEDIPTMTVKETVFKGKTSYKA